jgi:hypothetical protein
MLRRKSHWPAKLVPECARALVLQHAADLLLRARGGSAALPLRRYVQQLIVGMLLQMKKDRRDGELEVADAVDRAWRDVGRIALDPEQEAAG